MYAYMFYYGMISKTVGEKTQIAKAKYRTISFLYSPTTRQDSGALYIPARVEKKAREYAPTGEGSGSG